jgi:hypothetical protein
MTLSKSESPAESFTKKEANALEADLALKPRAEKAFDSSSLDDEYYRPIDSYEGLHRYDPGFKWEPEEEKKVIWKVNAHCQLTRKSRS